MVRGRAVAAALLAISVSTLFSGCFSLSLGTRTCTGDSPEMKARVHALENRVNALEQMISGSVAVPTEAIPQPGTP